MRYCCHRCGIEGFEAPVLCDRRGCGLRSVATVEAPRLRVPPPPPPPRERCEWAGCRHLAEPTLTYGIAKVLAFCERHGKEARRAARAGRVFVTSDGTVWTSRAGMRLLLGPGCDRFLDRHAQDARRELGAYFSAYVYQASVLEARYIAYCQDQAEREDLHRFLDRHPQGVPLEPVPLEPDPGYLGPRILLPYRTRRALGELADALSWEQWTDGDDGFVPDARGRLSEAQRQSWAANRDARIDATRQGAHR